VASAALPRAGTFRALRHRNFRLFWAAQLVSLTGTWMQTVAQGWLMYRLSGSPFLLGLLGFAQFLPVMLFALPGGVVADLTSKRRLLLATQTLMLVQAAALAALTTLGLVEPGTLLVLAFAFGVVNAFDLPARQSFVVEMVGKEDLGNAIALSSTAFNAARIAGPAAAGVVVAKVGEAGCFWINAASFAPVMAGLAAMRALVPTSGGGLDEGTPWERLRDGVRYALATGPIRSLLVLLGIMAGFGFQYMVLLPVYARDILGSGAGAYGMLVSAFGVGSLVSAFILARGPDRPGLRRGLLVGLTAAAAGMLVFARSRWLPLSLAAGFASGFGLILYVASTNTLIQLTTEDRYRGRVMSLYTLLFIGTAPLGSLTVGALAQRAGAPPATTFSGLVLLAGAIWVAHRLRKIALREAAGRVSVPGPEPEQ
jgi:MFS family permease